MEIVLSPDAEFDLKKWQGNKIILKKMAQLVKSIKKNPFQGVGKPEPLKHGLTGCWSRRITK